jgi:histidinol-phosphate aminotransferase
MKKISDLVDEFVKRPVVSMPPAVSVLKAMENYGLDSVVKMCSNENPFGVSLMAAAAMHDEIENIFNYADPEPENALREKIAQSVGVKAQNILITSGAAYALNFVGEVFIQPGDECILCSPTYPPYYSIILKNGGNIVDVPMTSDLKFNFDGIVAALTDKTKVIFICNPNNPTGCTVYREEMLKFVERIPEDVILVMDEAYVQFSKDPAALTMVPVLAYKNNIVVVQTFSKLYGLAGIRVGYAVSTPEIISFMGREAIARALNVVAVRGALAGMDDVEFARKTIENNANGREYLTEEFTKMGYTVYPSESNFVYVDFRVEPKEFSKKILPYGIIIRGDFPYLRISIGTMEQNKKLVTAIKEIMAEDGV